MTATLSEVSRAITNAVTAAAHSSDAEMARLWQAVERTALSGKMLRPRLALRVFDACGGIGERIIPVAAAIELLHTALVLHDDVIDHDEVRRGQRNAISEFASAARDRGANASRAANYGTAAGIIAGDLALSLAYRVLGDGLDGCRNRDQVAAIFHGAVYAAANGELTDVALAGHLSAHVTQDDVVRMHRLKTAGYSFVAPMCAGAAMADADAATLAWIRQVAEHLGVAYQLQDDIDGLFADHATTGKDPLSDLREGKATALMTHARTTPGWHTVSVLVGNPDVGPADLDHVRRTLVATGSLAHVRQLIADTYQHARDLTPPEQTPADLVAWLTRLCRDEERAA